MIIGVWRPRYETKNKIKSISYYEITNINETELFEKYFKEK